MFEKLRKATFFLIIFCLPFQVGLHFWPRFSTISGIRIDYLSPTLYLLDILIVLFILFSLPYLKKLSFPKNTFLKFILTVFLLDVGLNIFLSKSQGAHIYGIVKLAELGIFGFLVAKTFHKEDIPYFIDALSLAAIVSSSLAILQFFKQGSLGGFWFFLGERNFDVSTIGISTVNAGQQLLRAYGAFPHPNVLAFFLLTAIVFSTFRISYEKHGFEKIFLILSICLSSIALILSFSRVAILITICFLLYEFFSKSKSNTFRFGLILIIIGGGLKLLSFPWIQSFLLRGINFRQELFTQSFIILSNNLYFGVGLNNFFIYQAPLIKNISPVLFQPVHNIFVLALLQLGVFAFWIFPVAFVLAVRSLFRKIQTRDVEVRDFYKSILFILGSIVIVGMFDHFFLTLEQGQIMLALILGLSFSKVSS